MTDRWKAVAQLFEKAIDTPPSERETLLQRECGDDAELRQQVERLLEDDARAGDDFLVPASQSSKLDGLECGEMERGGLAPADGPDPLIGRTIGGYTIQSVIAQGGMGTVYLAAQERPHREVALKIMTGGFWSRSAQRRFEFETETLGRLHHPNIAQVYESGIHRLETGPTVPFFAMEYVPGAKPITAYSDERGLDLRARLKLFCVVCDAVHHGHQKGVVHRDLKPANILVDEQGHVKVIDFGVARSTDSDVAVTTMHTEARQLIGTLAYMSPEQAGGTGGSAATPADIDTRSDVYSLGVVLFELLTGRLPYDVSHMTIHAAARVICEQEPAKPSMLKNCGTGVPPVKLHGDLDTIILKCLNKDRTKRYNSIAALAEDIGRYLRGEPVEARPPGRWTRAARWIGRHPAVTTATACVTIAAFALVLVYVSVWYVNQRPHRIEFDRQTGHEDEPCAQTARLVTRSGRTLQTWTGPQYNSVELAQLVERPRELGGGPVVVVLALTNPQWSARRSLRVYNPRNSLDEPEWVAELREGEPLPDPHRRNHSAREFTCSDAAVIDVFPEHPGVEIVACLKHTNYSQCVIRIYDLRGEVLYEIWQDGGVSSAYWMQDARQLVFAGWNAEAFWAERGYPQAEVDYPFVIFGVRPAAGSINHGLLGVEPGDGPLDPVWYQCLFPPESVAMRATRFYLRVFPPRKLDPGRAVGVGAYSIPGWNLGWEVDKYGIEVVGTRVVADNYRRAQDAAATQPGTGPPDPSLIRLHDLPPIVKPETQPAEP